MVSQDDTGEERKAEMQQQRASLTLASIVAYRDATTDRYYERCCVGAMTGRAVPASLREVAPLDPGCAGCGVPILGQAQLSWGRTLLHRETESGEVIPTSEEGATRVQ